MALLDIVKYDGEENVFAWKFPSDDLSTKSQLIVNESQVAVLFRGGKAYDIFEPGRHTLDTANIPLLNKIVNLPFGGETPFKAEIWYVNTVHTLDIKWGTQTPVNIQDPKYGLYVPVSAYGQFGMTISDPKAFLKKMVGTIPSFNREHVTKFFRGMYTTHVKDEISTYLLEKKISILQLGAYLNELSDFMKTQMKPEFEEYGIELLNFYIEDISAPEDDEGVIKLKQALSKRAEMDIVGFDYKEERTFDTLEGAAKNEGSSSEFLGAGVGLGMGAAMGQTFGSVMGDMNKEVLENETINCPNCQHVAKSTDKFCPNCAQAMTTSDKHCSCGAKVSKDQKFCHECGGNLLNVCQNCKTALDVGVKFCPNCGEEASNHE